MSISLTPEQQAWLAARVAPGEFLSIDDAARQLIYEGIGARTAQESDLAWAKPYFDNALAAVERGEVMSLEEHKARNAARLAVLDD